MLEYKFADRKKYFVKVDKWFPSSQICNGCGKVHSEMKNLNNRIMKCDCGLIIGRVKMLQSIQKGRSAYTEISIVNLSHKGRLGTSQTERLWTLCKTMRILFLYLYSSGD